MAAPVSAIHRALRFSSAPRRLGGGLIAALCLASVLHADPALEVHELFEKAAGALGAGKAQEFDSAFDPAMPGFASIRANVAALARGFDAQSSIEWTRNDGDAQTRTVELNWLLDLTERGGASGATKRRAHVVCRLEKRVAGWRIVSFTPADFFAPPDGDAAWQVLVAAAMGLTEGGAVNDEPDNPRANTAKFMQAFDPQMAGYAQLKDSVMALEQGWDIESGVDLVRNEGDDRTRTIEVSWSLNLVSRQTSVAAVRRSQTLTCKLEKQGKRWRIISLEPRSLFAPPAQ